MMFDIISTFLHLKAMFAEFHIPRKILGVLLHKCFIYFLYAQLVYNVKFLYFVIDWIIDFCDNVVLEPLSTFVLLSSWP